MLNKFFFGYLTHAWKRLSRSIVCILLIINAFYVQNFYIALFYIPSLPLEDLYYEYQSFMVDGLFIWLFNGDYNFFTETFLESFSLFIAISFITSIPLILTTAFLSWIIMPFVVREN